MLLGRAPREHPHGVRVGRPHARRAPSPGGCGPATDLNTLFDGAGEPSRAGTMDRGRAASTTRTTACPTCGSCSGHLHGELDELPLRGPRHRAAGQRHHPGRVLRAHPPGEACGHEGRWSCWSSGITAPSDILSAAAVHNAMECDMAFGGSTNTVLHLTAIAREAAAHAPSPWTTGTLRSARTPHLVKLAALRAAPASPTCTRLGGVPVVMRELAAAGPARPQAPSPAMGPLDPNTWRTCAEAGRRRGGAAPTATPSRPGGALRVAARQPRSRTAPS